jgi:hypothetical protein
MITGDPDSVDRSVAVLNMRVFAPEGDLEWVPLSLGLVVACCHVPEWAGVSGPWDARKRVLPNHEAR